MTYFLLKACILEVMLLTEGAWEEAASSSSKVINESDALWNKNQKTKTNQGTTSYGLAFKWVWQQKVKFKGWVCIVQPFHGKITPEMSGSKNNLFHHPWKFCFHVIVFMGHYMYFDEFHVLFRAHVKTNHFHGPWKSLVKEFTGHGTHCGNFHGQFMGREILGKFMPSNKAMKLYFAGFVCHKKIFKGFSREIYGIFRQLWFIVILVLLL